MNEWFLACFGPDIAMDKVERNHRFLEEALELVQSLGCSQSEAHQLVDYVFARPIGEPNQEAGGTLVTLAALLTASRLDMRICGELELDRVWTKVEKIRAKQAAKPKHSPLPEGDAILDPSRMPAPDALVRMHDGQIMPAMFWFAIEDSNLDEIASEHGFETGYRDMLGSLETDEANEVLKTAYEVNPADTLAGWRTDIPNGWQFGGKWHTEDGATACFLRKREVAP